MNDAFRPDYQKTSVTPARRRRSIAYVAIVALTAVGVAAAWTALRQHRTDDKRIEPTPALTVTVMRPVDAVWPVTLEASGAIAAWQEASIGAQVGGYRLVEGFVD